MFLLPKKPPGTWGDAGCARTSHVSSISSRMQTLGVRLAVVADVVVFILEGLVGGVRREACGSKRRRRKKGEGEGEGGESELTFE